MERPLLSLLARSAVVPLAATSSSRTAWGTLTLRPPLRRRERHTGVVSAILGRDRPAGGAFDVAQQIALLCIA
jgi:hypothetical protein